MQAKKKTHPLNRFLGAITGLLVLLLVWLITSVTAQEPVPGPPPTWPTPPPVEPAIITRTGDLTATVYLPIVQKPFDLDASVDPQNRDASQAFYLSQYLASEGVAADWTGNHASCNPGTTSAAFREAILRRINYFRAMAGVPPVTGLKDEYNQKAQAAALMMSVNGRLSHSPDSSWTCYSAAGEEGAGSSNLYLGQYGPGAISGYVYDPGSGNYFAGHRRWILYPQTQFMGSGDIPPTSGYWPANGLWVFDRVNMWGPRPATRETYVAWPPPGYVPYQVIYPRWSFAYDEADLSNAGVTMTVNGTSLPLTVNAVVNGYGENTLVWEPNYAFGSAPGSDTTFHITINNVVISGSPQTFAYDVMMFDPAD